ncbi:transposase family protein [Proteiniphilum sp. X52]|uniref:transposase family protein n=1 Tax=Proteiniphilum sp. X52 TaxID=2382159 RepID=UPI000F0A6356|nr:transposase family protein [Proteiniphilum sp. X52]RNC65394.1 transposase family protein [Proteiniphilum sp. X52]
MRTSDILEKILVTINDLWRVDDVQVKEDEKSVYVHLSHKFDFVESEGKRYPIYDYRHERNWRHLDLWQYKTYLVLTGIAGYLVTIVYWNRADQGE